MANQLVQLLQQPHLHCHPSLFYLSSNPSFAPCRGIRLTPLCNGSIKPACPQTWQFTFCHCKDTKATGMVAYWSPGSQSPDHYLAQPPVYPAQPVPPKLGLQIQQLNCWMLCFSVTLLTVPYQYHIQKLPLLTQDHTRWHSALTWHCNQLSPGLKLLCSLTQQLTARSALPTQSMKFFCFTLNYY